MTMDQLVWVPDLNRFAKEKLVSLKYQWHYPKRERLYRS
jgi:hypothetical protein